jgi:peroxiredoxin
MSSRTIFKSGGLDVLAGFVALCFLLASVVVYKRNDLQLFSLVTAVLFFLAGVLRGASAPQNPLLKALLIDFGGAVPVIVMRVTRMAFTEQGYVLLFVAFSLSLAMVGAETRHLLARRLLRAASLLAFLSFAAATLVVGMAIPVLMERWSSEEVNRPAPSFSFATLDGKPVSSADLRGHVVVLAFWATWCVPCRQELPHLQKAYEQYKGNSNVTFYAVGGPWGGDTIEKESAFANQMRLNLPLAFDSHGTAQGLGVSTFPALVILDGAGHVRMIHNGYDASEHLARHISREVAAMIGNRT